MLPPDRSARMPIHSTRYVLLSFRDWRIPQLIFGVIGFLSLVLLVLCAIYGVGAVLLGCSGHPRLLLLGAALLFAAVLLLHYGVPLLLRNNIEYSLWPLPFLLRRVEDITIERLNTPCPACQAAGRIRPLRYVWPLRYPQLKGESIDSYGTEVRCPSGAHHYAVTEDIRREKAQWLHDIEPPPSGWSTVILAPERTRSTRVPPQVTRVLTRRLRTSIALILAVGLVGLSAGPWLFVLGVLLLYSPSILVSLAGVAVIALSLLALVYTGTTLLAAAAGSVPLLTSDRLFHRQGYLFFANGRLQVEIYPDATCPLCMLELPRTPPRLYPTHLRIAGRSRSVMRCKEKPNEHVFLYNPGDHTMRIPRQPA